MPPALGGSFLAVAICGAVGAAVAATTAAAGGGAGTSYFAAAAAAVTAWLLRSLLSISRSPVQEPPKLPLQGCGQRRPRLEVRPSTIPGAGSGLFAAEDFREGRRLVEYTGRILTLKQTMSLADRSYLKMVTLNRHIDGSVPEASVARYVNDHIDKARINTRFVTVGGRRVYVEALRDVALGQELFCDYGRAHWVLGTSAEFLGLEVVRPLGVVGGGGLRAARPLSKFEVLCSYETPHGGDGPTLGKHIRVGVDPNCELSPNPFVRDTTMVRAIRDLTVGEELVLAAAED